MPKMKKAPKSKTQMIKDHKAAISILQEQLTTAREEIESLKLHPPVLPTDRDEEGNVLVPEKPAAPAESAPEQAKPDKPDKFKLPGNHPFRVMRSGDTVFLTAKAIGGDKVTMMFTRERARQVGMVLCKNAVQQPQEAAAQE